MDADRGRIFDMSGLEKQKSPFSVNLLSNVDITFLELESFNPLILLSPNLWLSGRFSQRSQSMSLTYNSSEIFVGAVINTTNKCFSQGYRKEYITRWSEGNIELYEQLHSLLDIARR